MEKTFMDYKELARDVRLDLEHERERMMDKVEQLNGYLQLMDGTDELIAKYQKALEENEALQQQLVEERKQRAEPRGGRCRRS